MVLPRHQRPQQQHQQQTRRWSRGYRLREQIPRDKLLPLTAQGKSGRQLLMLVSRQQKEALANRKRREPMAKP